MLITFWVIEKNEEGGERNPPPAWYGKGKDNTLLYGKELISYLIFFDSMNDEKKNNFREEKLILEEQSIFDTVFPGKFLLTCRGTKKEVVYFFVGWLLYFLFL